MGFDQCEETAELFLDPVGFSDADAVLGIRYIGRKATTLLQQLLMTGDQADAVFFCLKPLTLHTTLPETLLYKLPGQFKISWTIYLI